jgi:hypothetical protein
VDIKNNYQSKSIPLEEAINDPRFKGLKEAVLVIEDKVSRGEILFPNKFLALQKSDCGKMLWQMRKDNENIKFNDAIIEILKKLPKQMPADMYPPLMKHLVSKWEKMSITVADKSEKTTPSRELVHL